MQIQVYFDGSCGLCRREIKHYQQRDHARAFEWIDISRQPQALDSTGIDLASAMRSLHVRDAQGHWHIGVSAFIILWKNLPGWRWAGHLASLPGINRCLRWAYARFAAWRIRRSKRRNLSCALNKS